VNRKVSDVTGVLQIQPVTWRNSEFNNVLVLTYFGHDLLVSVWSGLVWSWDPKSWSWSWDTQSWSWSWSWDTQSWSWSQIVLSRLQHYKLLKTDLWLVHLQPGLCKDILYMRAPLILWSSENNDKLWSSENNDKLWSSEINDKHCLSCLWFSLLTVADKGFQI